jgi:hypothetical protein
MLYIPPHAQLLFKIVTPIQAFDIFATSKKQSLLGSKKGTIGLAKRFEGVFHAIASKEVKDEATRKAVFEEMVENCLWENATDLPLLTSLSVESLTTGRVKRSQMPPKQKSSWTTPKKSRPSYRSCGPPAQLERFIF